MIPQSAVLAYRMVGHEMEILLVTSKTRGRWVLPKGMITAGMTPAESAVKEAWEEAGVAGVSGQCLGVYRYIKTRRCGVKACSVKVYAMKVTAVMAKWPEQRMRRRRWMRIEEAICSVMDRDLRRLLITFRARRLSHRLACQGVAAQPSNGHAYWGRGGHDDDLGSVAACRHVYGPLGQDQWRPRKEAEWTPAPWPGVIKGSPAVLGGRRRPGGGAVRLDR